MPRTRTLAPTLGLAALAAFSVFAAPPPARAQGYTVTVTDLNPAGSPFTQAEGVSSGTQVGFGGASGEHALLWKGSAGSVVDLHPASFFGSLAESVSGNTQVGFGIYDDNDNTTHALLWHGTAAGVIDLNPEGFAYSSADAVYGDTQVGGGYKAGSGFSDEHALLWQGTADSVVDLNPAGFTTSAAVGVYGSTQVGFGGAGGSSMPCSGTAPQLSVVDLTPLGYSAASASGVSGDTQVGAGYPPSTNGRHALLWHGTAGSVVDLHPASGFMESVATGVSGGVQVGYGSNGNQEHALLWRGTAASVIDLNRFLPHGLNTESQAYGVSAQGNVVDVVGLGSPTRSDNGAHAVLWHIVFSAKPSIAHLYPASRTVGRDAFSLTVSGSGFTAASKVQWNGAAQATAFVSATTLTASIPASLIAAAGTAQVTVSTPGAGTSNAHTETIMPRPTLSSLSPASKKAGSGAFTLTVTGTGFRPASFYSPSVVKWNDIELTTTYVSDTKLTALVPAALVAHGGTATVTVTTPQVATTDPKTFTVTP